MRITAELQSTGGNTAGFPIPDEFVTELGGGGRPKVVVRMNDFEFRSSIAKMGGEYWLGVSQDRRQAAGVAPGQTLDLEITLDTQERTIEVPDDLAQALAAEPAAQATFDGLSFSNKRYHVDQITGAKTAATRERRIAKSVETLAAGKPR
jgi:hypothetical protein